MVERPAWRPFDWVRFMTGQLDGRAAYIQGKLKIKGDAGLAMKFQTLFKTPS
jgi:putative sterol carrier protein